MTKIIASFCIISGFVHDMRQAHLFQQHPCPLCNKLPHLAFRLHGFCCVCKRAICSIHQGMAACSQLAEKLPLLLLGLFT